MPDQAVQDEAALGMPGDPVTFTCVIAGDPDSRVSISDQGKARWEPGDQILVHGEYTGAGKSATVTLKASDISSDGKTATITFSGVTPYDRTDKHYTSKLYAGYPAEAIPLDEHCYYYTNFRSTTVPMVAAYNEGNKFVFYNLCGVISFKVSGDFDSYEFSGNEGETVGYDYFRSYLVQQESGTPRLDYSYVNESDGGTSGPLSSVTGSVTADGSTVNYLGMPLGAKFTGGFTFKFYKNGKLVKTAKTTKAVNVARKKILPLGDITSRLQDPTPGETHQSAIDISKATDLGATETANCYVITKPGSYKFKAVKGNSTTSVGTLDGVQLVWETCCNATVPEKNSIIAAVDYEGSWLCFNTPATLKPGNALIAAKDESGKILWSWHIWIPSSEIGRMNYNLSTHYMMDRNLGALEPTVASGTVRPESYGLLYQWGRKDPFVGAKAYNSSSSAAVSGTAKTVHTGPMTIAETIAGPTVFANPNAEKTDWCTTSNAELWGYTSGAKTVYDPCPPGYKVPKRDEAPAFYNNDITGLPNFEYNSTYGWFTVGEPMATFPLAGYLETSGGQTHAYDRGLLWNSRSDSSNPYAGYGQYLYYDSDVSILKSRTYSQSKARAATLRCESVEEIPFENAPGMPVQGSYTKLVFDTSIQELSGICFSADKDFIWGVGDEGDIFKIYLDWTKSAITLKSISIYK